MLVSKVSYVCIIMYFAPKNCVLNLFFVNCKMKMAFWSNFSPIYYINYYIIQIALKSLFHLAGHKKGSKCNFLDRNTFSVNIACFARKLFLRFRSRSKLVGTPCNILSKKGWHVTSLWSILVYEKCNRLLLHCTFLIHGRHRSIDVTRICLWRFETPFVVLCH